MSSNPIKVSTLTFSEENPAEIHCERDWPVMVRNEKDLKELLEDYGDVELTEKGKSGKNMRYEMPHLSESRNEAHSLNAAQCRKYGSN